MNKLKITAFLTMSVIVLGVISCAKKKDDNNNALLLLLLLGSGGTTQSTQQTQATQATKAVSAVASSITSAATSGQVSGKFDFKKPEKLLAAVHRQRYINLTKNSLPYFVPTALTKSSGSCTSSACNAVISGSASCSGGGTYTLTNFTVALTFPSSSSYSGTMSGPVTLTKCNASGTDYFDYPKIVAGTSSGDLTLSGTFGSTISNLTSTSTAVSATIVYSDDNTIQSTAGLTVNGTATGAIKDLKSTSNITAKISGTNFASTTATTAGGITTFTFSGDYTDIIDGKVSVTGTVGGSAVNQSKTYSNQTFKYKINCTIKSSTDSFTYDCTTS